ncbi:MAG: hypothetical protein ACYS47_00355 [Planctomycetota bacterium]|jgi:predicted small lipoprotein YifL
MRGNHRIRLFLEWFGLLAALSLPACGMKSAEKVPPAQADAPAAQATETPVEKRAEPGKEEEDHECTGRHGEGEDQIPCPTCPNQPSDAHWLIDIGDHTYLGRIDVFSEEGKVILNIYDHHTKEALPHEISEVTLNVVLDGTSRQFKMAPLRGDEDLIGETSRYKVVDPALKGRTTLKGRINISLEGKDYLCDLKAVH